jgi:hypothetical protein
VLPNILHQPRLAGKTPNQVNTMYRVQCERAQALSVSLYLNAFYQSIIRSRAALPQRINETRGLSDRFHQARRLIDGRVVLFPSMFTSSYAA